MLSLQPRLKGWLHLGQLFELRWEHTSGTSRYQQEYLLCVCVSVQCPHCTLYSISCLFPSSWGSAWRFFSISDTIAKALKTQPRFSTSAFRITRCTWTKSRNGTYLPFPLYLWSALLYRWWPVWVVANRQTTPITRLRFQKGLTTGSDWSSWTTTCERRKKMLRSCHQLWFLKNDTWVEHILLHFWEFRKRLGDLRHLVQMSIKSRL